MTCRTKRVQRAVWRNLDCPRTDFSDHDLVAFRREIFGTHALADLARAQGLTPHDRCKCLAQRIHIRVQVAPNRQSQSLRRSWLHPQKNLLYAPFGESTKATFDRQGWFY